MNVLRTFVRHLGTVVVDPAAAMRSAARTPEPVVIGLGIIALATLVATAGLPRQFDLLSRALAPTGDLLRDLRTTTMESGLTRLILGDRLVPPPTLVLAALLLAAAADPVLALARDRRRALWAVVLLGLTPLLAQRLGELAVTYLTVFDAVPRAGDAVTLPHTFSTGPALLWPGERAPVWLTSLSQRVNLVAAWAVALWAIGLKELDRGKLAAWHVTLPVGCLLVATVITWWLSPIATAMLLGRP